MPIILIIFIVLIVFILLSRESGDIILVVENGKLLSKRGRLPEAVLAEFSDVVKDVDRGKIIGHSTPNGYELRFKGNIDDSISQRLRNILGIHKC